MCRTDLQLFAGMALCTAVFWALHMLPLVPPAGGAGVQGYAYAPSRVNIEAGRGPLASAATIESDMAFLAGQTKSVRTYSVADGLAQVPALAQARGLQVTLGAWVSGDPSADRVERTALVTLAEASLNVDRLVVGNESLLRQRVTLAELTGHLDAVRAMTELPVTTAEPWHVWLQFPELAEHVDLITVHLLPYWEGVPASDAVNYLFQRLQQVRERFPGKIVVIGEVGWPSRGPSQGAAVPSQRNQTLFVRQFLLEAERRGVEYFLMEAFDQPWKTSIEGEVGAYWGLFDTDRKPRMALAGSLQHLPADLMLAAFSALTAGILFLLLTLDGSGLKPTGRLWLALPSTVLGNAVFWALYDHAGRYSVASVRVAAVIQGIAAGALIVLMLVELHEWVESRWGARRRRQHQAQARLDLEHDFPMVSIHVPAYNEPPELLVDTLRTLAQLDYPNFEVIVVDNNTPDQARWRPVEAECRSLGPRFRFLHVEGLAGYKAGALNLALRHTTEQARLVAVIDSDYQVRPDWLRAVLGFFGDPEVALVQGPQDYRDGRQSLFKSACTAEYATFFAAGMVTRNERNAIIQHGTMSLVRRDVLEAVGGWAEWTITEDAELGLRILAAGHQSVYLNECFGQGVSPDRFSDYAAQRFRWAFGAMQIMRAHAGLLLGRTGDRLTSGQRYHYVAGWLPWLADGLNLIVSLLAIGWSILMAVYSTHLTVPSALWTLPPLALFVLRLLKALDLQFNCNRVGLDRALLGTLAGLALTFTVGRAVLSACIGSDMPFVRTPKHARPHGLIAALRGVRAELLLAMALVACAAATRHVIPAGGIDALLWSGLLLALALPHFSALGLAVAGALTGAGKAERLSPAVERVAATEPEFEQRCRSDHARSE